MGAYRYFGLRIGCCLFRGLLLFVRGRNTFLLCTLDVIGFAVCCCPAEAYRLFILRIENNSLRNPLQVGNQGAPGAHELQETCESQKYPICMNSKRPPVECVNHKKTRSKKISVPNGVAFFLFSIIWTTSVFSPDTHTPSCAQTCITGFPGFH